MPADALRAGLTRHCETSAPLDASPQAAFDYLDDFRHLAAHMEASSPMLMGSKMTITTDALEGRTVGSRVSMRGRMLGMALSLEEVVTQRNPPFDKAWQTESTSLLVIGPYRLGFALQPEGSGSRLRVAMDYRLPETWPGRWLGMLLGGVYARWCTGRMARDAAKHFKVAAVSAAK